MAASGKLGFRHERPWLPPWRLPIVAFVIFVIVVVAMIYEHEIINVVSSNAQLRQAPAKRYTVSPTMAFSEGVNVVNISVQPQRDCAIYEIVFSKRRKRRI